MKCVVIDMDAYHRGVVSGMQQSLALMEKYGLEKHAAAQFLANRIREREAVAAGEVNA